MGGRQSRSDIPVFHEMNLDLGTDYMNSSDLKFDRVQASRDWAEVFKCDIRSWVNGICCSFGFDEKVNFCIAPTSSEKCKEVHTKNIQPQCTRGYQLQVQTENDYGRRFYLRRTPSTRKRITRFLQIEKPKLFVSTIPSSIGHFVQIHTVPVWCVIGYQTNIAVVQFTDKLQMVCKFFVVVLTSNEIMSEFSESYTRHPCLYEAYISPNERYYLLRPNLLFAVRNFEDPFSELCLTKDIRVMCISEETTAMVHLIRDIHHSEYWYSLAFDPRFGHGYVAFGNYTSRRFQDCIAIYDLNEHKVVKQTLERAYGCHHIAYSPDGRFLASLTNHLLTLRLDLVSPMEVYLHNSDTLDVLHCISRNVFMSNFHAGLTPIFSRTCEYVALVGQYGQNISVYRLPRCLSLGHQCRIVIRRIVYDADITVLPLPRRIQDYLLYRPEIQQTTIL